MNIKTTFTEHDSAAMTALYLQDGMRVLVIIDDGTATVPQPGYESLFDSQLPNVIDGNSEALLYVPDRDKEITYDDEEYQPQTITVRKDALYKFRLIDGKMVATVYAGGRALRELLLAGM